MRICIYGLGAIGGLIAGRLAAAGANVSAVARGATLAAVRERGLSVIDASGTATSTRIAVSDQPGDLGPQDFVVVAVKASVLPAATADIARLLRPTTTIVSAMNGVPWWFFQGMPKAPEGLRLDSVDPQGAVTRALDPRRVLGTVLHLAAASPAPGVVRAVAGDRILLGEPAGGADSPRARAMLDALATAGFDCAGVPSIQQEIWFKLWGNMTVNPVSALTGATGDRILDDELVRGFMTRCMQEAARIGEAIGLPIETSPEERHAVTRKLGAFRTSMLQDVESGKPVEIDALVTAVREIASQVQLPTPYIDALLGLARLHASVRGLYPAG
jgi:2-dehydropantoate 2-reductase